MTSRECFTVYGNRLVLADYIAEELVALCSFNRLFMMKTVFILFFLGHHCFPLSCGVEILDKTMITVLMQRVYVRYTNTHAS